MAMISGMSGRKASGSSPTSPINADKLENEGKNLAAPPFYLSINRTKTFDKMLETNCQVGYFCSLSFVVTFFFFFFFFL